MVTSRNGFSRRRFSQGMAAAGIGVGLAAPAGAGRAQSPEASPAGGWSFTDARGFVIATPTRPTRVVAQTFMAQSLHDFGYEVAGHFGVDNSADGFQSTGDLDLDALPFVGAFGEYDLEMLLVLEADLIVDFSYGEGEDAAFWYLDPSSYEQFQSVAPVLGVPMAGTSIDDNIGFVRDLAEALGANVGTPEILADIKSYDAASTAFTAANESNPGVKVLALQGTAEEVYLANPAWHSDLIYFGELGVTFASFEVDDEIYPFWGTYSSEELGTIPIDVYLTIGDLSSIPIWNELAGVKAGQVAEWRFSTRVSYRGFTVNLTELTETISNATVVME